MTDQRSDILARIQRAASLPEQMALVAELDQYDRMQREAHASARSIDLAATTVQETLSPVFAHERSTHETDWLGEITAAAEDVSDKVTVEAAMWYRRLSDEVKADAEEFAEQARGMARRTASAHGDRAAALEQEFLQYVGFLRQREAASGLPQVQQIVDSQENPAATPLPQDVFDNFAPEVHPINQGVSGSETSERAPLMQEIMGQGGGQGQAEVPNHHDTAPVPYTYAEVPPGAPEQMTQPTASLFLPTVAISHMATLDDFRPGGSMHEAASGLPQVQQVVDSFENPAPTPLPEEVAYPWTIDEESEEAKKKAALRAQADQWSQSGPQFHGPGAANSPFTTPEGTSGTFDEGYTEGRSDWPDSAPTVADASSAAPEFVRGHSQGYQDAAHANPHPTTTPDIPPSLVGPGQAVKHAAGRNPYGWLENHQCEDDGSGKCKTCAQPIPEDLRAHAASSDVTCASCGAQGKRWEMTSRGNGSTVQSYCRDCKPMTQDRWENDFPKRGSLRVSAAFTAPVDHADAEFAKAYRYALRWTPAKPLVRTGSVAFEAGLYAGISDNPDQQGPWVQSHREASRVYGREFLARLSKHREFSKKASRGLEGFRVVGNYLRPVEAAEDNSMGCRLCHWPSQDDWNKMSDHERTAWRYSSSVPVSPEESRRHEEHSKTASKTAATTTDLDTVGPATSPSPSGETPINGPGHPGPLAGGSDPAAPGGPSPYNGAPPYGQPAVPTGVAPHGQPVAISDTPGAAVDQAAQERVSPQQMSPATVAFRKTVQANLLKAAEYGDVARGRDNEAKLKDVEFNSPFHIGEDGSVTRTDDYVPSTEHHDEHDMLIDGVPHKQHRDWEALSGYSGQQSYGGPVFHPSEYVGGGLANHLFDNPGTYAYTAVEDPDDQDHPAGWAILRKREK